ncbi:MAG TPA: hypothetical protein VK421_05185 [Pyrinomonadaceae bacterium]|nr:hypothetical protein [Pyrinomonadaceae bacterium]
MKTLTRLLTVAALASLFALPSFAQDEAAAANPCESAERTELYTKYFEQKKAQDQAPAFETAKQYLAKYETACPDQYTKAVKKFHDAYAAAFGAAKQEQAFTEAVNAKDARKSFETGRQLLAKDPDRVGIYLSTASTGYNAVLPKGPNAGDAALTAETIASAKKAIELLQAGKEPKDNAGKVNWGAFKSRDEALGWAHYWVGSLEKDRNAAEAAKHLIAVAQSNSTLKEEPTVYIYLAEVYEKERQPLADKYTATCKELTPECEVMLANINQVVDRQIDAYARAVSYAKDEARRKAWMDTLKALYKSRNNGAEDGLDAKIAAVKTTPLLITTPVTTPPPAPTPAPGNGQPVAERKP